MSYKHRLPTLPSRYNQISQRDPRTSAEVGWNFWLCRSHENFTKAEHPCSIFFPCEVAANTPLLSRAPIQSLYKACRLCAGALHYHLLRYHNHHTLPSPTSCAHPAILKTCTLTTCHTFITHKHSHHHYQRNPSSCAMVATMTFDDLARTFQSIGPFMPEDDDTTRTFSFFVLLVVVFLSNPDSSPALQANLRASPSSHLQQNVVVVQLVIEQLRLLFR